MRENAKRYLYREDRFLGVNGGRSLILHVHRGCGSSRRVEATTTNSCSVVAEPFVLSDGYDIKTDLKATRCLESLTASTVCKRDLHSKEHVRTARPTDDVSRSGPEAEPVPRRQSGPRSQIAEAVVFWSSTLC